ncbi:uncharacterized protein LOC132554970 [Ylistrum balloti]|uniref:uncharacterized protein LOC132554970 n=1 Tax=Ylistrum balloti TaxID=509963 RepID=UPI002905ECD6|nr:uncharacterized protein LOC132554970 [Ylistrum balloti]
MREVIHFDQYKVPQDTRYWREGMSTKLRNDLHSSCYEQVEQRKVIYIDLPKEHKNHILGMAADLKSPIDERVLKKICKLVDEGVYNPKEMHRHLKIYIKDLFKDRELPRVTNRRFYPSKDDLRKIIYRQRRKTLHSLIDQEDLEEKIRVWQEERPDDI